MNESNQCYEAGRLIQWVLQPGVSPHHDSEYRQLLNQFLDFPSFRLIVKLIAAGLGLECVGEDIRGLVFVPTETSIFAMKPSEKTVDDRLINGLIQIAILATIFPRAQDLEEDPTIARPPISIDEVELTLREICDRLEAEADEQPDPSVAEHAAGLDETWRVCCRRANVRETPTGRLSPKAIRSLIQKGLDTLRDQGCLQRTQHEGEYRPTWRYRVMVQQFTALQIHNTVRNVLDP